jgi:hypothetical protein
MRKRGLAKVKELFWYSDSEPNEVLISFCHLICLPLALIYEFDNPSILFIIGAAAAGAFQLWAVVWKGCLKYRLIAVQIAFLIAIMTIINLSIAGLMAGSRTGWIIIAVFAAWNTLRVFKEKLDRYV